MRRLLPLLVLALGLGLALAFGLDDYLSLEALKRHRATLQELVARHWLAAGLAFTAIYAVSVACSVPGATLLTITGGFLFGVVAATIFVLIGATLGAVGIFLATRTALGGVLRRRAGPWLARLEDGFRANAFSYLLTLRLVPLVPFWLVNLVPAFFGVGVGTFALATFLGIIPGTIVYVGVGNGLAATLDSGGDPDLGLIFRPAILLPLIGLALLSLLPIAYRRLRARRSG